MIALALLLAVQHEGHMMPGMAMPMPKAKPKRAAEPRPATRPAVKRPVHAPAAAMPAMAEMPGMPMPAAEPSTPEHAAMGHCPAQATTSPSAAAAPPSGTDLPAGNAPPPAAPVVDYADAQYGTGMASSRAAFYREHGGSRLSQVMLNLAEMQVRNGRDGYRWDGEGWFGGDIDRLVVKSEGRADFGHRPDEAEIQALWSHAVGPYFNLQAGARYDFRPNPSRTYATVGFEGLAPYWFEVGGAVFVSDKGNVLARAESWYDQRITQRLILQPRVEANLAAQDDRTRGIGRGISDLELGLRLRYELAREFAPYVGLSWDRKLGGTARYARAAGEGASDASLVAGVRFWF